MIKVFSDDDLKRLKEDLRQYRNEQFDDWGMSADETEALLARLEASERCVEAIRKWLVNQGPQEDIDLTMIAWRKECGK